MGRTAASEGWLEDRDPDPPVPSRHREMAGRWPGDATWSDFGPSSTRARSFWWHGRAGSVLCTYLVLIGATGAGVASMPHVLLRGGVRGVSGSGVQVGEETPILVERSSIHAYTR